MRTLGKLLVSFLIFFVLAGFVLTCSFLVFFSAAEVPASQVRTAAVATLVNALFLSLLFTLVDLLRRKWTVERPVKQINSALERITAGDFSVRLDPTRAPERFAVIMKGINRMTGELAGVETLRSDFVSNVSHEIKTPLAVLRNYGQLLSAPGLPEEQRLEYAAVISDTASRLAELVTNVLRLNRLENQQIFPQKVRFDLGEQLCRCLLGFEQVWEEKEITLETDLPEDVVLEGDEELLELVWNNLISNAFKFTPSGGTVSLAMRPEEDCVLVTVSDTGCGMTADTGAHIFEKFYQGDTSHACAGNGLGLALVRRVIDITGGAITVKSTPGQGSTFTVRLPRA